MFVCIQALTTTFVQIQIFKKIVQPVILLEVFIETGDRRNNPHSRPLWAKKTGTARD